MPLMYLAEAQPVCAIHALVADIRHGMPSFLAPRSDSDLPTGKARRLPHPGHPQLLGYSYDPLAIRMLWQV